jgi:Zn-dependent M16 (insulinase) family peptidase
MCLVLPLLAEAEAERIKNTQHLILSVQETLGEISITFRTHLSDSTGVSHIFEHSVLCGSRKYPVKEPFVELLKGSMNTFLNAFTYPDRTCYRVASQVRLLTITSCLGEDSFSLCLCVRVCERE